jgi:DICT domain-containing protein
MLNNPEDQKLVTLAQATLKRSGAKQAAALRDNTGRTYVAVAVDSSSLVLDAVEAVFTVAMASQISGIEAVVFSGERSAKTAVISEFAPTASIFFANDGAVPDKIA